MKKAPIFDDLPFDQGWRPSDLGIGDRHVVQALVVSAVVVELDEGLGRGLETTGDEVVLE